METIQNNPQAVNQTYQYAANLLVHGRKTTDEVKQALVQQGLDIETSSTIVENLEKE